MQKQLFKEGQSVYFEPGWEADIKKMVVDKMIPKEWKDREFIISSVFYDDDEDTFVITNGVMGDYPNVLLKVDEEDVSEFMAAVASISSEADYGELLATYGVRRTDSKFWEVSDEVARVNQQMAPLASGILDYNRLENR